MEEEREGRDGRGSFGRNRRIRGRGGGGRRREEKRCNWAKEREKMSME